MLNTNSIYLKVDTGPNVTKKDLAKNVEYAAILYVICGLFSVLLISCHRCTDVLDDDGGRHYIEYDDGPSDAWGENSPRALVSKDT